jgi:hypothetical protein
MRIELQRQRCLLARSLPLEVRLDGRLLATLDCGQRCILELPAHGGVLLVAQGILASPPLTITPADHHRRFVCGNPWWVLLDLVGLCYLPPLAQRALFLRPA